MRGNTNGKQTLSAAHELNSQIDPVLKVMRQNSNKPCRHHPVQPGQSDTVIITVTQKHLQGMPKINKKNSAL